MQLRSDELIDWLDFSYKSDRGIEWMDDLRSDTSWLPRIRTKLGDTEKLQLEVMRKIVARDRIYNGYLSQYQYFSDAGIRPSAVQHYIESIPQENKIND